MNDPYTPLLAAWKSYLEVVVKKPEAEAAVEMAAFFCGAAVVTKLVTDAGEQGGTQEATLAFRMLAMEAEAFHDAISQKQEPRH